MEGSDTFCHTPDAEVCPANGNQCHISIASERSGMHTSRYLKQFTGDVATVILSQMEIWVAWQQTALLRLFDVSLD